MHLWLLGLIIIIIIISLRSSERGGSGKVETVQMENRLLYHHKSDRSFYVGCWLRMKRPPLDSAQAGSSNNNCCDRSFQVISASVTFVRGNGSPGGSVKSSHLPAWFDTYHDKDHCGVDDCGVDR